MPARELRVGFVFQHYALFGHMTVYDNIAFDLTVRPRYLRPSKPEINAKVCERLERVQPAGLARRFPSQLSGGQRRRVALARVFAVNPKVLLLDESFGARAAKVRLELRSWLRAWHDDLHVTSLLVTLVQSKALEVADTVVLVNAGQIEQMDTPEEACRRPATPFVASFFQHGGASRAPRAGGSHSG